MARRLAVKCRASAGDGGGLGATGPGGHGKDQMGAILDEGAFRRAMREVPAAEAQALRVEFDAHMERLYSVWMEANPVQADAVQAE